MQHLSFCKLFSTQSLFDIVFCKHMGEKWLISNGLNADSIIIYWEIYEVDMRLIVNCLDTCQLWHTNADPGEELEQGTSKDDG